MASCGTLDRLSLAAKLFRKHYPPGFSRKVLAEFISTFLLVFVTCGSGAISSTDESKISQLGASIAGGLIVTVMIYEVGHVSGAHMDPAVYTAFAAVRHFPWKQVPLYAAAQISGAISAAFALRILLHPVKHICTTSPSGTQLQALIMEIVVTFAMMFVASAVATDAKAGGTSRVGRWVFGIVLITSIFAGPISGGSMNPARSLGPAIASSYYNGIWVYIVGPITGTLAGAWSYSLIRTVEDIKPDEFNNTSSFHIRGMGSENNAHASI